MKPENVLFKANKRLTILSEEEKCALYDLPDFNEAHQHEYLVFTVEEQKVIFSRSTLSAQLYCSLQFGYFKAKQMFFTFAWDEVPQEDIDFLKKCYFPSQKFTLNPITKYEYYEQIKQISNFYNYRLWSKDFTDQLYKFVVKTSKKDISISFILTELLQFLNNEKIIRPGYSILQQIISKAINTERERLGDIITKALNEQTKPLLKQLLSRDDVLSYLATLKTRLQKFWL